MSRDSRGLQAGIVSAEAAKPGCDGLDVTSAGQRQSSRLTEEISHLASFPQFNPHPVLEVNTAGTVIFSNPATRKILESLGLDTTAVELFLPVDLHRILNNSDSESTAVLYREVSVSDRVFAESIVLEPHLGVARIYAFDITGHKRTEEELRLSEERVRRKLESILSPDGDIGNLELADIIDAPALQALVDNFYELSGMPMGLTDIKGRVLVGVGWQDICTKFHRISPEACRNCLESDVYLSAGIPHGEYKIYKCRNNMWDVATPIMVGDAHFGNIFMGQFFFEDEPVDYELFRAQARQFGFDELSYIKALKAVPRLSRKSLDISMSFFMNLAGMISQMSFSNLKLARSLAERDALTASRAASEERFRNLFNRHQAVMLLVDPADGAIVDGNASASRFYGLSRAELRRRKIQEFNQLNPDEVAVLLQEVASEQQNNFSAKHRLANGEIRWVEVYSTPVETQGKTLLFSIIHDITERKRVDEALKKLNEELERRVVERTEDLNNTVAYLENEIAERINAEESVLRLNRLYAVLSETNQAIVRTMDQDTLFNEFCRIAVEHGSFRLACVGLVDEQSGAVNIVAAQGAVGYLDNINITVKGDKAGLGPTGISIREGTYYICNDFLEAPVTRPWHDRARDHGILASASIALKQEGHVIGALTIYADKKDFFDQQQVALLQQMGVDISFALDNIVRETRRQEMERALLKETTERLQATEALRENEQMLVQQSRNAAMGEMIGNIAHQWRQPLNTLGLEIQQLLLMHDLGKFNREFLDKTVANSMDLIRHMSRTIDDFRNYFMPDKEKAEFNVFESLQNTISLLEGCFKNPKIAIEIVASDRPDVYGYQNEFAQVILNFLVNARDALVERDIKDPRILITLGSEAGCTIITVADNAGGIPEEIIDKIFDPYFTTKGPQQGTGVGLFMSKTIIETNMGGHLTVRNNEAGAEFRVEVCSKKPA